MKTKDVVSCMWSGDNPQLAQPALNWCMADIGKILGC